MGFFLAFEQSVWSFSGLFLALFGFLLKILSGKSAHKLLISTKVGHNLLKPF